jgi:hypothetical protein
MPNRKTFDSRDRYDHSSHTTSNKEQGDLAATPDSRPTEVTPEKSAPTPLNKRGTRPRHSG